MQQVEEVGKRFERLMDAIEFGDVVPFLGAGISKSANPPEGNGLGGKLHDYSMNNKLLLQVLRDCWRPDGTVDEAWWGFVKADLKLPMPAACEPPSLPEPTGLLGELEEQMGGSGSGFAPPLPLLAKLATHVQGLASPLARLSELVAMRHGYVKLCDVLDLHRFTELEPTAAHQALARLLLEGAFTEVITTNYDMCLERALAQQLGIDDAGIHDRGALPDKLRCQLDVVDRASGYLGGDSGAHTPRRPRYYKINGCAGAWRRACDAFDASSAGSLGGTTPTEHEARALRRWRQAKRMILTERQLQTFRAERWAEEMFRDRARSGHLLFCGFGNEEPQIRHTALAIMREFEDLADEDREGNSEKKLWSLGAAPWFHQYNDQLQFFQMQVLHGWRHAWLREPGDPQDGATTAPEGGGFKVPGAPLRPWAPPRNAFTQLDREFFGLAKDGLTADAFWEAILREWWRRKFTAAWQLDAMKRQPGRSLWLEAARAIPSESATRLQGALHNAAEGLFRPTGALNRRSASTAFRILHQAPPALVSSKPQPCYRAFEGIHHRLMAEAAAVLGLLRAALSPADGSAPELAVDGWLDEGERELVLRFPQGTTVAVTGAGDGPRSPVAGVTSKLIRIQLNLLQAHGSSSGAPTPEGAVSAGRSGSAAVYPTTDARQLLAAVEVLATADDLTSLLGKQLLNTARRQQPNFRRNAAPAEVQP